MLHMYIFWLNSFFSPHILAIEDYMYDSRCRICEWTNVLDIEFTNYIICYYYKRVTILFTARECVLELSLIGSLKLI